MKNEFSSRPLIMAALAALSMQALAACSNATSASDAETASGDYERGPHRGRMLRDGDFAVEITIFEDGVDPEFRVYAYDNDEPIDPRNVQLSMALSRLGNKIDRFAFKPQEDFLRGDGVVTEPHSFDVAVNATHDRRTREWTYQSYEGRTVITAENAQAAGVVVEPAGSAVIEETVDLAGRVELQPQGLAKVAAWFPGRVTELTKSIGERVEKGDVLARVISNESQQPYSIPAPIAGVIMERNANIGDVAGAEPIYVIADASKVHAEFYVYPRDAERLRAGQAVTVRNLGGDHAIEATIEAILPTSDMMTQTIVAHVDLPNDDLAWRPGQAVEGSAVVGAKEVPLAVRTRALQPFRDFTVVFARVGETYEVRMLDLGRQNGEWTEVLGGISAGEIYVADNAFLIRADIEKSGASHDH